MAKNTRAHKGEVPSLNSLSPRNDPTAEVLNFALHPRSLHRLDLVVDSAAHSEASLSGSEGIACAWQHARYAAVPRVDQVHGVEPEI